MQYYVSLKEKEKLKISKQKLKEKEFLIDIMDLDIEEQDKKKQVNEMIIKYLQEFINKNDNMTVKEKDEEIKKFEILQKVFIEKGSLIQNSQKI